MGMRFLNQTMVVLFVTEDEEHFHLRQIHPFPNVDLDEIELIAVGHVIEIYSGRREGGNIGTF